MAHRVTCQASTTATDLPTELVTLTCTPEVPDIHLPWTCAAPGRVPATTPTHPRGVSVGFGTAGESRGSYDRMKTTVQQELRQHFRPEFLNRVDDTIVFRQLSREEILTIVDLMIAKVDQRLKDRDMGLELLPAARALLSERGYDPVAGARPLRRTIQREIEDNLSEKILFGELRAGQIVTVDVEGTGPEAQFTFEGVARPGAVPDAPPAVI
jgi:ATP-dependent Clp protease ATP-binding subunit ClpC